MKYEMLLLTMLFGACAVPSHAQMAWPPGKTAAIALTYDDALDSQLRYAVPQLAGAQMKATFFLDEILGPAGIRRWREVQRAGHQLGNHSLHHPCPAAMLAGRPQYHTEDYDAARMLDEIAVMNDVLFGIDGLESRSYSVPCSQMKLGDGEYTEALRRSGLVKYVRTGGDAYRSVITDFKALDMFQVPSWGPVDGPDGGQLIAYVERVRAAHGLGVFQFHGVGGDYLAVSAQAHHELIDYLAAHREVWVAPFADILDYVSSHNR